MKSWHTLPTFRVLLSAGWNVAAGLTRVNPNWPYKAQHLTKSHCEPVRLQADLKISGVNCWHFWVNDCYRTFWIVLVCFALWVTKIHRIYFVRSVLFWILIFLKTELVFCLSGLDTASWTHLNGFHYRTISEWRGDWIFFSISVLLNSECWQDWNTETERD